MTDTVHHDTCACDRPASALHAASPPSWPPTTSIQLAWLSLAVRKLRLRLLGPIDELVESGPPPPLPATAFFRCHWRIDSRRRRRASADSILRTRKADISLWTG